MTKNIVEFASRSFTYYTTPLNTGAAVTTAFGSMNLQTTYGGSNADEVGLVKTETIGGACTGCGSSGGQSTITREYFYLDLAPADSNNPLSNEVVRLVIEDTRDASGTGRYRTVHSLDDSGRMLRRRSSKTRLALPSTGAIPGNSPWTANTCSRNSGSPARTA